MQAAKREASNLAAAEAADAGAELDSAGADGTAAAAALEERRRSAAEAAAVGDGPGCTGGFRDGDYYVPAARADRYQEEGFSVRGGADSALAGAVLDLMADDEVRSWTWACLYACMLRAGLDLAPEPCNAGCWSTTALLRHGKCSAWG